MTPLSLAALPQLNTFSNTHGFFIDGCWSTTQKLSTEQTVPDRNPGQRNKVKHQFYFQNIKTRAWQLVIFHCVTPTRTVVNFIYRTANLKCTIRFWVVTLELKALWYWPLPLSISRDLILRLCILRRNSQKELSRKKWRGGNTKSYTVIFFLFVVCSSFLRVVVCF